MPCRTYRSLLLWFFVALQAMMPLIHAHAGAVQLNHSDFLHLHQGAYNDATCHATPLNEHGAEVDVAEGRPLRIDALDPADAALPAASRVQPCSVATHQPGAGLPAPPPFAPPDHTYPPALAPPAG